ncbi:MAG: hypothetical protein ACRCUP_06535 [Mycoplasmatales bacterium]
MACPKCGSNNLEVSTMPVTKGFGFCNGLLGLICLGPIGLICGLCGMGKTIGRKTYVYCKDCGFHWRA